MPISTRDLVKGHNPATPPDHSDYDELKLKDNELNPMEHFPLAFTAKPMQ